MNENNSNNLNENVLNTIMANIQSLSAKGEVENDNVPWNAETGVYLSIYRNGNEISSTALIVHFNCGWGSCPAAQLKFTHRNGSIYYRTAVNYDGFTEPWTKITQNNITVSSSVPSTASDGDIWIKS